MVEVTASKADFGPAATPGPSHCRTRRATHNTVPTIAAHAYQPGTALAGRRISESSPIAAKAATAAETPARKYQSQRICDKNVPATAFPTISKGFTRSVSEAISTANDGPVP